MLQKSALRDCQACKQAVEGNDCPYCLAGQNRQRLYQRGHRRDRALERGRARPELGQYHLEQRGRLAEPLSDANERAAVAQF